MTDNQFSALSAYWGYPPHYGRLNGRNAWAPQVTQAGEYLEVRDTEISELVVPEIYPTN